MQTSNKSIVISKSLGKGVIGGKQIESADGKDEGGVQAREKVRRDCIRQK